MAREEVADSLELRDYFTIFEYNKEHEKRTQDISYIPIY